MLLINFLG